MQKRLIKFKKIKIKKKIYDLFHQHKFQSKNNDDQTYERIFRKFCNASFLNIRIISKNYKNYFSLYE